jgi:hypothetical protein
MASPLVGQKGDPMKECFACKIHCPDNKFDDHLRVYHPEWPRFERWPDGALVIVDRTLEPEDFGPGVGAT